MKNLKKLIVCVLTLGMVVAMSPVNMLAAENLPTEQWDLDVTFKGNDIILENVTVQDLGSGFTCVTIEDSWNDVVENVRGIPEKTVVKKFQHNIYGSDGGLMATLETTVTGVYDQTQNTAFITDAIGIITGVLSNQFVYSQEINGATATIVLYYNLIRVGGFVYTIANNGTISFYQIQ